METCGRTNRFRYLKKHDCPLNRLISDLLSGLSSNVTYSLSCPFKFFHKFGTHNVKLGLNSSDGFDLLEKSTKAEENVGAVTRKMCVIMASYCVWREIEWIQTSLFSPNFSAFLSKALQVMHWSTFWKAFRFHWLIETYFKILVVA